MQVFSLFEVAATAIGAGVLIGTFLGATTGLYNGRSRKEVEADSLRNGYWGAVMALLALLLDWRNV